MFCSQCGKEIPDQSVSCQWCGAQQNVQQEVPNQAEGTPPQSNYQAPQQPYQAPQQPYQAPQQPYQAQQPYQPPQQNYQQPGYTPPPIYQQPYQNPQQPVINTTPLLVFSIINLVCCSPLFGLIALILTATSKNSGSYEEQAKKLRIAKILNIVGIVVSAVMVIVYLILIAIGMIDLDSYGYSSLY